jgi:hypothetical protein
MAVNPLRGTRDAARLLGIPPGRLNRAVWDGRIPAPQRSPAGDYLWDDEDMRRACRALLGRALGEVLAARGEKQL